MAQYNERIAGRLMSDLMADFGLTREQAAGIVGNLVHESDGFKSLQEIDPSVKGSRGGYGYAQWTASRRREFEDFVEEKDWDITSYQANYGNLKRELEGEYAYVIDRIKRAETAKEASKVFEDDFERPGKPHSATRAKHANHILTNPNTGFVPAIPTARNISQQEHAVRSQMLDPFSDNMGLVVRQETPFHSEYAPGLGNIPTSSIGPSPVRGDYPTGQANPEPWTDSHASAAEYAPRSASTNRFDRSFTVNPAADNHSMRQTVTDHKQEILRLLMQKRMPGMIGVQPGGVPHGFAGTSRLAPDAIGETTRFLPFSKPRSK